MGIDRKTLIHGHSVDGVAYEFPRRCPGAGCAIADWLRQQAVRRMYESLRKEEEAEP